MTYDRGSTTKPGQIQQGSGTTPTCFDDFAGNQFVAGATENSLIAVHDSIIVENNYGNATPKSTLSAP
jgi:hypothetical protein